MNTFILDALENWNIYLEYLETFQSLNTVVFTSFTWLTEQGWPFHMWKHILVIKLLGVEVSGLCLGQWHHRVQHLCRQDNPWPCSCLSNAKSLKLEYQLCISVTVFYLSKHCGMLLCSSQQVWHSSSHYGQLEAKSEHSLHSKIWYWFMTMVMHAMKQKGAVLRVADHLCKFLAGQWVCSSGEPLEVLLVMIDG